MILNEAYGTKHDWVHIPTDRYKKINDYLHFNEATLASVGTDDMAHYFVVVRDKLGLHAINAQGGDSGPLKDYIRSMEEKGFGHNTFYIVSSRHTLTSPKEYDKVTMKLVKKYFPMKHEVDGNLDEPDSVLTKAERRHHLKLFRSWGLDISPNSSLGSSIKSNSNEEWTIPTSRSRAGRRAKSERKYSSKVKSSNP
jgi:hypothetical protein